MFQKHTVTIVLNHSLRQIHKISCAFDGSFVLLGKFSNNLLPLSEIDNKLLHLSKDGKVLGQWIQPENINSFEMMTPHQVVMADLSKRTLDIFDLKNQKYSCLTLPKQHIDRQTLSTSELFFQSFKLFHETHLLVLKQSTEKFTKIAYYDYHQIKDNFEPIKEYLLEKGFRSLSIMDNYSRIAIWSKSQTLMKYSIIFLDHNKQLYRFKNINFAQYFQHEKLSINMSFPHLYRIEVDYYLLEIGYYVSNSFATKHFTFDVRKDQEHPIITEVIFEDEYFDKKQTLAEALDKVTLFYNWQNVKEKPESLYFTDIESRTILHVDPQEASQLFFYDDIYVPTWDRNVVLRVQHHGQNTKELKLTVARFISKFPIRQEYINMLLHVDDDLDDDLLQDCIDLLS